MDKNNREINHFEVFFRHHYEAAVRFAIRLTNAIRDAEDIVQQSFLNIWLRQQKGIEIDNPEAYLFRSVHNSCINYLKKNQLSTTQLDVNIDVSLPIENPIEIRELQIKISNALEKLPPKCKTIFLLSRYEGLKYNEIADQLHLSIKTVEAQMSKALHILRKELKDYLPILLILAFIKK